MRKRRGGDRLEEEGMGKEEKEEERKEDQKIDQKKKRKSIV